MGELVLALFFGFGLAADQTPGARPLLPISEIAATLGQTLHANTSVVRPEQDQTEEEPAANQIFSDFTLFLFASGLALFVALLGWSDQIRGINQDTRELETRFLATTQINRQDFLSVVKPNSPDDQLTALTQIMVSGKAATDAAVEVLRIFNQWHKGWTQLEKLATYKYRLTVILTCGMFVAGFLSLFENPQARIYFLPFHPRTDLIILLVPMATLLAILILIIIANYKEEYFRKLLNMLLEKV
jgi:hypothetical protein